MEQLKYNLVRTLISHTNSYQNKLDALSRVYCETVCIVLTWSCQAKLPILCKILAGKSAEQDNIYIVTISNDPASVVRNRMN